jgi:hypothetical protein
LKTGFHFGTGISHPNHIFFGVTLLNCISFLSACFKKNAPVLPSSPRNSQEQVREDHTTARTHRQAPAYLDIGTPINTTNGQTIPIATMPNPSQNHDIIFSTMKSEDLRNFRRMDAVFSSYYTAISSKSRPEEESKTYGAVLTPFITAYQTAIEKDLERTWWHDQSLLKMTRGCFLENKLSHYSSQVHPNEAWPCLWINVLLDMSKNTDPMPTDKKASFQSLLRETQKSTLHALASDQMPPGSTYEKLLHPQQRPLLLETLMNVIQETPTDASQQEIARTIVNEHIFYSFLEDLFNLRREELYPVETNYFHQSPPVMIN